MEIRPLHLDDSAALVPLLRQLGYPSAQVSIRDRAERLLSDERVGCWVAVDDDQIVGLLTAHLSWHIEFDAPAARLTALVVDEDARRKGVARALTAGFEDWARQHGASKASLSSSADRGDAHATYESLGWAATGIRFAKELV